MFGPSGFASKMNESSTRDTITLSVYGGMALNKNVFFMVIILMYLATVIANVSLMLFIYLDTSLHKPMYIFLFSLILNGLIGSTAVWPQVMNILSTNITTTSYRGCLVQVFIMVSYGVCNYSVLTIMAYDRFVSIFYPLKYHTVMTEQKVKQLLVVANGLPAVVVLGQVCLTSQLPLCKYTIPKLFCDNLAVSSLSCADSIQSRVTNLYGICVITLLIVLPVFLILLSYVKIIVLCLKASRNARMKALETCSPHIIVFINFSFATLFSVIYNRVSTILPIDVNLFVSINYILVPPLLHPIIYGIKNKEIRQSMSKIKKKTICCV